MILTSDEAQPEITYWNQTSGYVVSDNTAQTIASWWHSPGRTAITRLSHGLPVDFDMLEDEVRDELNDAPDVPSLTELHALLDWIVKRTA